MTSTDNVKELNDKTFDEYPEESLAAWHKRMREEGKI